MSFGKVVSWWSCGFNIFLQWLARQISSRSRLPSLDYHTFWGSSFFVVFCPEEQPWCVARNVAYSPIRTNHCFSWFLFCCFSHFAALRWAGSRICWAISHISFAFSEVGMVFAISPQPTDVFTAKQPMARVRYFTACAWATTMWENQLAKVKLTAVWS